MDAVVKEWCIDSSIGCRCSIIRCSTDSCIVHIDCKGKYDSNMIDYLEYHGSTSTTD